MTWRMPRKALTMTIMQSSFTKRPPTCSPPATINTSAAAGTTIENRLFQPANGSMLKGCQLLYNPLASKTHEPVSRHGYSAHTAGGRSDERRVGKAWGRTGRYRWVEAQ